MMKRLTIGLLGMLTLVGLVNAQVFVDFEDPLLGEQGFADNGWGDAFTSVARAADPTSRSDAVLEIAISNADGAFHKGAIQIDNLEAGGAAVISFYVYIPSDFPDDGYVKVWANDDDGLEWTDQLYSPTDLAKDTCLTPNYPVLSPCLIPSTSHPPLPPNSPPSLSFPGVHFVRLSQ